MSSPRYIELHARSAFSFLRGACIPEEYATIAASHNSPAMALTDVDDLARRVPQLHKDELEKLAAAHRRDALWKAGRAGRPTGPLLEEVPENSPEDPLRRMTTPNASPPTTTEPA
jgi:hypothetical protein